MTCQNCGATQGPFEREVVGTRTMPIVIIGCARGKKLPSGPHEGTRACLNRRIALDAKRYPVQEAI